MGAPPAAGAPGESVRAVGTSEGELIGAPHERQNLSDSDNSPEQEGHLMTVLRSRVTTINPMRRSYDQLALGHRRAKPWGG